VTDNLRALLEGSKAVCLIDWPNQEVPATLVRAGYTVVAPRHPPSDDASPYLLHEVTSDAATADEGASFPLGDGARLVFRPLDELPASIDIVSTFRPADEQPGIVDEAIRLGARAVWVEPGEPVSEDARRAAVAAGLLFVDGVSIADEVRKLGGKR
jgi:hypothetical protein